MILHRLLPDPGDVEIRPGRFCFFSPNAVPVHDGRNASAIDDDGHAWTASPLKTLENLNILEARSRNEDR